MFTLRFLPQSVHGYHHRSIRRAESPSITFLNPRRNVFPRPFVMRPKVVVGLQGRQNLAPIFSTNSNSSDGDSVSEDLDGAKSSAGSSAQGPPFLTILAGFIVLFLLVKAFGSIIMWLVGLIVNAPKSK